MQNYGILQLLYSIDSWGCINTVFNKYYKLPINNIKFVITVHIIGIISYDMHIEIV